MNFISYSECATSKSCAGRYPSEIFRTGLTKRLCAPVGIRIQFRTEGRVEECVALCREYGIGGDWDTSQKPRIPAQCITLLAHVHRDLHSPCSFNVLPTLMY